MKITVQLQARALVPATAHCVSSQTVSTEQVFWKKPGVAFCG